METAPGLTTAELGGWVSALATLTPSADDAERIDRLRLLEEVKAAAAAAQARETAAFKASQLQEQEEAGVPVARRGRGIGHQVALARREAPHRAGRLVGLAEALVHEMPHTLTALTEGRLSEWRATLMVQATACLTRDDRARVDAELADRFDGLGDRALADTARGIADRLDPQAAVMRVRRAEADRRVTLKPLPDTMVGLFGVLPASSGVAAFAALQVAADRARATGDPRSRGQLMADTLLARLAGTEIAGPSTRATTPEEQAQQQTEPQTEQQTEPQTESVSTPMTWADRIAATTWAGCDSETAEQAPPEPRGAAEPVETPGAWPVHGVEIQLVMTDQTLFGVGPGADEPAYLTGYGSLPATVARELVTEALQGAALPAESSREVAVWVRRLYAEPGSGVLTQMESTRRTVPPGLARFLLTRDRFCRTPWCGAPIRHVDHVRPHAAGGPTNETNLQGLCEACNHAKQAPGWRAHPGSSGAATTVQLSTPTGHRYLSWPPDLPGVRGRSA